MLPFGVSAFVVWDMMQREAHKKRRVAVTTKSSTFTFKEDHALSKRLDIIRLAIVSASALSTDYVHKPHAINPAPYFADPLACISFVN